MVIELSTFIGLLAIVITDLKKVVSRKRASKFSVCLAAGYDRLARLRSRWIAPKLLSVLISNYGIIFSDSIAID